MTNPQNEFKQWQEDNARRKRDVENSKKAAQKEAKRKKDQATFRTQIYANNREIDQKKTLIRNVGISLTPAIEEYNQANRDARDPGGEAGSTISPSEQALIDSKLSVVNQLKKARNDAKDRVDQLEKDNIVLRKKLNDTIKPDPWEKEASKNVSSRNTGKSKTPSLNPDPSGKIDLPKGYKYNLPLLKNAWHHPLGAQAIALGRTVETAEGVVAATGGGSYILNPGNYKDAMRAWAGVNPGRGTIQNNKRLFQAMAINKGKENIKDYQMYGFKFLYNPKEINMVYSTYGAINPEYQATGRDEITLITTTGSMISFNLLLNRIEDMDYVTSTGLYPDKRGIYGPGKANVDAEAIDIYNKGTMYDLEYFFKTLFAPLGSFVSEFNIETTDYGYLIPKIVDLHLGASMRYRVIPQSLAVTHLIFNPRMVPVLTSVKMDVARLPQIILPELQKNFKQNRAIGVTGYGGVSRNEYR